MRIVSRNAERMIRDRNDAAKTLSALSDALIADLVRRAGNRATGESKGVGPKGKGSISDPTLAAVLRTEQKFNDPVFDAVREIAFALNDIRRLTQSIDDKVRFVTQGAERVKQSTIIHCEACGREIAGTANDRVRSGYCAADFQAWLRAGKPYRYTFELSRRARAAELENRQK